jgi:putative endopeptidase
MAAARWFGRCECKPGEDTFYHEANGWWANDESIQIPGEYSSWGSFIQLHDASLKTQVELCTELAGKASSEDEKKVAMIWNARMSKFKEWDEGKGDYEPILAELAELSALPQESVAAWSAALGRYFVKCMRSGIKTPLSFDKGANLSDSENVVLDLSPASGSLPSRDYYTEENFAEQRAQFKEHLTKVAALVGLEADFAERVMRFETKVSPQGLDPGPFPCAVERLALESLR